MKKVMAIMLFIVSQQLYSQDVDFSWSLIDAGFEYVDNSINLSIRALRFNWIEREKTGLGISLGLVDYHKYENEAYFNLEAIWNPFAIIDRYDNYFNFGIYDRINWNGGRNEDNFIFYNAVGVKLSYSLNPMGRTGSKGNSKYNTYLSTFFEYQSNSTFRAGASIEILMAFRPLVAGWITVRDGVKNAGKTVNLIPYSVDELGMRINLPEDIYGITQNTANDKSVKRYNADEIKEAQDMFVKNNIYLRSLDTESSWSDQSVYIYAIRDNDSRNLNLLSNDELSVLWQRENNRFNYNGIKSQFKKYYRTDALTFIVFEQEGSLASNRKHKIYSNMYLTYINGMKIMIDIQSDNSHVTNKQIELYERVINSIRFE